MLISLLCLHAAGGTVTLSATVTGPSTPFTYQWTAQTSGGGQSPDATKLSTTFTGVQGDPGANAALYVLAVTNACGTTSSAPATVMPSVRSPKLVASKVRSRMGRRGCRTRPNHPVT